MAICLILLPLVGTFLLFPDNAYAWGPATHLHIGIEVLRYLSALKEAPGGLLLNYPYAYLYGCIGADIIFAKGLAKLHEHSHSWHVGLDVLEEASSPSQRAFAYGYLSHLAADSIAHNYFIPEQIIKTYATKTLRHLYWEVRFDTHARKGCCSLALDVARSHSPENDELLEKVVRRTLFSFRTDRKIFHSLLVLNRMKQWQKMLATLSTTSAWKLSPQEVERYNRRSVISSLDFLTHHVHASCLLMDPMGKDILLSAKCVRKNLRILSKKGRLTPELYTRLVSSLHSDAVSSATHLSPMT